MLCFKFKLPRHKNMINGTIENILIRSSLLNILDWISWDLEEIAVRVISVP